MTKGTINVYGYSFDKIERIKPEDFPFRTTIRKRDKRYEFT